MAVPHRTDALARLLGYSGLLLGIAGAAAIILLGGNVAIASAMLSALLATTALATLRSGHDQAAIWATTALWTTAIGVIAILSVGVIFLIASIFLLAAFTRSSG